MMELAFEKLETEITCPNCGRVYKWSCDNWVAGVQPPCLPCDECAAKLDAEHKAQAERERVADMLIAGNIPQEFVAWNAALATPTGRALRKFAVENLSRSMWLTSNTGSGKSRALCVAAVYAIKAGRRVRYLNWEQLSLQVGAMNDRELVAYRKWLTNGIDVVIVDDVAAGAAKITAEESRLLYWLFDTAYLSGGKLDIWVASNVTGHQMQYDDPSTGQRFSSRVKRMAKDNRLAFIDCRNRNGVVARDNSKDGK